MQEVNFIQADFGDWFWRAWLQVFYKMNFTGTSSPKRTTRLICKQ